MNELNQNISENLEIFFMGFRDEVIRGIKECLELNAYIESEV